MADASAWWWPKAGADCGLLRFFSPFLFSVSLRFFAAVSLQVELLVLGQRSHDLAREKEKKPPPMLWPRCGSVRHSDVGLHGDGGLHGNCATVIIGKNLDRSTHPNTIRNSPPQSRKQLNHYPRKKERMKERKRFGFESSETPRN